MRPEGLPAQNSCQTPPPYLRGSSLHKDDWFRAHLWRWRDLCRPPGVARRCADCRHSVLGGVGSPMAMSDDLGTLNRQVIQLYRAGKYVDATDIASRALAMAERQFGRSAIGVGITLDNLGLLYRAPGPLCGGRAAAQARDGDSMRGRSARTTQTVRIRGAGTQSGRYDGCGPREVVRRRASR
jgi:hypothetical protein